MLTGKRRHVPLLLFCLLGEYDWDLAWIGCVLIHNHRWNKFWESAILWGSRLGSTTGLRYISDGARNLQENSWFIQHSPSFNNSLFLFSRKCSLVVEASDETELTSFDDCMKTNEILRLLVCVDLCLNRYRVVCLLTNKENRIGSRIAAGSRWDTQHLLWSISFSADGFQGTVFSPQDSGCMLVLKLLG